MATKSTKFLYNINLKIAAFILTVILLCLELVIGLNFASSADFETVDLLSREKYTDSRDFTHLQDRTYNQLSEIVLHYKSEENILNGGTVAKEDLTKEKEVLFRDKESQIFALMRRQNLYLPINTRDEEAWRVFEKEYDQEITGLKTKIINQDLIEFRTLLENLNKQKGLVYEVRANNYLLTNTTNQAPENFETYSWNFKHTLTDQNTVYSVNYAFTADFIQDMNTRFLQEKANYIENMREFSAVLIVILLMVLYLIVVVGRKDSKTKTEPSIFDKIYTEVLAIAIICFIAIGVAIMQTWNISSNYFMLSWLFIIAALNLACFLLLVKHLKNRDFLRNTLVFILLFKIFDFIESVLGNGSFMVRVILAVIVFGLLTMIPFAGIVTIPLAAWFIHRWVLEYNSLKRGIEEIKEGKFEQKIELKHSKDLQAMAQDINTIADGLNSEVENRIKSEKMKTELISNVSHDLKTPLTSIISYVDLLKREEIDNEQAKRYIGVLEQKSNRLKVLIEDLFEASKISSGNIPVVFDNVDLVALLQQGLGELDERIAASNLVFKTNIPNEPIKVIADGKLLWRVVENLLTNVFKYALENSRVYIDLEKMGENAELIIKNISAYELNIPDEELFERFTRGDDSRHSEGSGLGLSIAKSLMKSQNGDLSIVIDGDLFKVIVSIPISE